MRRLVFLTQQLDPDHPALGATVPKLRALAERLDEVAVICDRFVPQAVPPGVRVSTFGAGARAARGARFAAALARELHREPRPVAVLAHMVPLYAILAAPLVRARRVPLALWFTHWRDTRRLRLAERLADVVFTVE